MALTLSGADIIDTDTTHFLVSFHNVVYNGYNSFFSVHKMVLFYAYDIKSGEQYTFLWGMLVLKFIMSNIFFSS